MTEVLYNDFITKSLNFCKGDGSLANSIESLNNITEAYSGKEIETLVGDLLWYIDTVLSESYTDRHKENFVSVIRACEKAVSLNTAFLKDRLSDEMLEALRLIGSRQQHSARYVKTKTRVFYKQNKFNLVREANEGFSKLMVELAVFREAPEAMLERIKSLIGYFDLDPNRVVDLVLDVMEVRLQRADVFLQLLALLGADKQDVADLLGHKLAAAAAAGGDNDVNILRLIVILVHAGAVLLDAVFEHLVPGEDALRQQHKRDLEAARTRKNTIRLKEDDKIEVDEEEKPVDIVDYSVYQHIRLCHYFLEAGDWTRTKTIMNWLPPFLVFRDPGFTTLYCSYIETLIEPLYAVVCPLPTLLQSRREVIVSVLPTEFSAATVRQFLDMETLVFQLLDYLGPVLSSSPLLFSKLARISAAYFSQVTKSQLGPGSALDSVSSTSQGFYNLIRNCLLPSLSLFDGSISQAEELWDALRSLPFDMRYSLYISWTEPRSGCGLEEYTPLVEHRRSVQQQVRYILKRLSKENVKQFGRQLGKLCHCNPAIVFADVLNTVIMFSSLVIPVTDTFKYLGNLSLDVLMFSIITTLAATKIQPDDMQQNQTMQVISTFCGLLCKRYQFDLVGLFQFILAKLRDGQCAELALVKEVLHKMTGIEVSEDMTDDQMEAMSGGDLLRQEAGYFIQIRNVRKNSARLKDTLIQHNLAIPYVILLSQERNLIIEKVRGSHLKVVGRLYDQCQDTMLQMMTFFSIHWSSAEMVINCPSLGVLLSEYNVAPDVAFFLNRTHFNYKVQEKFALTKSDKTEPDNDEMDYYEMASQDVIDEYVTEIVPNLPHEIWDDFNSAFYATFWLLQTSDLKVPDGAYKKQEVYLKSQIRQTENDNSLSSLKKQKEVDRFNSLLEKMREEQKRCESHVRHVDHWLNAVKARWFVKNKSGPTRSVVMTRFIELCVFPRVCFSANDAVFVAHMIYKLHQMKTPSFSTLICLDRIFNDITLTVSTCSENEAKRYGIFLDTILRIIMRWHASEELYTQECIAHPGFVTVFRKNTDGNNKADQLTYENYRHVLHKWHYRVTKSVVSCLESDGYIQIRNALIVLEKILDHYPKVQQFGQAIERRVEALKDKEKDRRPDLHILTQSYHGHLIAKKTLWLQDKDFHCKEETKTKPVRAPDQINGSGDKESKKDIVTKRSGELDDKDPIDSKRRKVDAISKSRSLRLTISSSSGTRSRANDKSSTHGSRSSSSTTHRPSSKEALKMTSTPEKSPLRDSSSRRSVHRGRNA